MPQNAISNETPQIFVIVVAQETYKKSIRLYVQRVESSKGRFGVFRWLYIQESPADADKPARRESMQKLLQFDVFRFISPNSISPNFKLLMHSVARYV